MYNIIKLRKTKSMRNIKNIGGGVCNLTSPVKLNKKITHIVVRNDLLYSFVVR